jgi:adenylate kinase
MLKLIFAGIQGSGKGTQAKIIAKKLKIPHISTGDLLRDTQGKLREEIDSYMKEGKPVPNELVLRILKDKLNNLFGNWIKNTDSQKGFIIDGFPRNLEQAKELDKIVKIDALININISDAEAKRRLAGRWNCKKCGIPYNLITSPRPKVEGKCDKCGEKLYQRQDDINEESVDARLKWYRHEIAPLLKYYNTVNVNGEQPIEKVTEDIMKAAKMLTLFR